MHGLQIIAPRRNYWKDVPRARHLALKNFTPQLFTICMGTGVMAVLIRLNGYSFPGMHVIGVVVWMLDLILFSVIFTTFLCRWVWFKAATAHLFETDVEQTTYLSTTAIAAATLVELMSLYPGNLWDGWTMVCFAFFWCNMVLALVSATTTYWLLIRDEKVTISNLSPTLMYPTTGLLATAASGSVLMSYTPLTIRLCMPILMVSYLLLGAGFFLSLLTMSAYFLRLLHNQTPPAKKVGAQLIPLAPLSNAAYAFITLGYLAGPKRHILEEYGKGAIAEVGMGNGLYTAGFVLGLTIWGFATFWLIISIVAFIRDLPRTRFNLTMWSAAYPLGTYGVVCVQLAIDLDSPAFRVISTIILVWLVVYWLWLMAWTIPMVASGELFLGEVWEGMQKHREEQESEGSRGEGHRLEAREETGSTRSSTGTQV